VLQGVNLTIKRGDKIAVVGESGSGKSTLLMILQGMIAPSRGRVHIDGIPLTDCSDDTIRRLFAYDSAELPFIGGTIAENIAYASPATSDEVNRAAILAAADEFISRLPSSYDTMLTTDAGAFSTGQARRLGVARALVRKAHFIFLDEPTSSLDCRTEQQVFDNLLSSDCAIVVATHNTKMLHRFDRIIELHEGRIMYDGPPSEWTAAVEESEYLRN
jgi:ABC-type bacteriocin/lantibiotic exporter with double-glycine peptidase domain